MRKSGKIFKSKSNWIKPYPDHLSDELKIRLLLNEKIRGDKIIGLEAKIEPGKVHQLHIHEKEHVIVYSIEGDARLP